MMMKEGEVRIAGSRGRGRGGRGGRGEALGPTARHPALSTADPYPRPLLPLPHYQGNKLQPLNYKNSHVSYQTDLSPTPLQLIWRLRNSNFYIYASIYIYISFLSASVVSSPFRAWVLPFCHTCNRQISVDYRGGWNMIPNQWEEGTRGGVQQVQPRLN